MGFLDRVFNRQKAAPEPPAIQQPKPDIENLIFNLVGSTAKFQKWDAKEAIENGLKASAIFYACVRARSDAVSQVPWKVYREDADGERTELPDHPLKKLIDNPSPDFSWSEIMALISQHIDLAGNFYMREIRAGNEGLPMELLPLIPYGVSIIPGTMRLIERYDYTGPHGRKVPIAASDMIQIKTVNPNDFMFGLPTIQAAGRAVDIDRDAGIWQKSSLENRGVSDYAVVLDPATTTEQYERLKTSYKEKQGGPENARKPFFTTKDIKPLNQSAVEMDFVNSRLSTWQEIASAMGVPLPIIGVLSDATLANIETSRRIFWTDTVISLLRMICEQLNSQLAIEFGTDIKLGYDTSTIEALREDIGKKLDNARKLWDMAVPLATINEMLELNIPDIENIEGADIGYLSAGLLPAGEDLTGDMSGETDPDAAAQAAYGVPPPQKPSTQPGGGSVSDIQQQALNGAQMASLQSIAQAVADNALPAETALALIQVSIPGVSEAIARAIIEPADTFTPAPQEPPPEPPADA